MTNEQEKQAIKLRESSEKSNKRNIVRIITPVAAVVLIVILIYLKASNPSFSLGLFIGLLAVIVIIAVMMFFGQNIVGFFTGRKELSLSGIPPAESLENLRKIGIKALSNEYYANHFEGNKIIDDGFQMAGKNKNQQIYVMTGRLLYKSEEDGEYVAIVINAHYAKEGRIKIITSKKPIEDNRIRAAANLIADDSEEEEKTKKMSVIHPDGSVYQSEEPVKDESKELKKEHEDLEEKK